LSGYSEKGDVTRSAVLLHATTRNHAVVNAEGAPHVPYRDGGFFKISAGCP
jgi:hypothetical protein